MIFRPFLAPSALFVLFNVASAQEPAFPPALGYKDTYQLNAIGNLDKADSFVDMTNAGFHNTTIFGHGYICANIYVFSPDEQMVSCCTCPKSANGLYSLSARNDLINNTLTPGVPTSIVIKIIDTTPPGGPEAPTTCNAAVLPTANVLGGTGATYIGGAFATGDRAWATNYHVTPVAGGTFAYGTQTRFEEVPLSPLELEKIRLLCGFIQTNGSNFGICRSCRLGYLGGAKQ